MLCRTQINLLIFIYLIQRIADALPSRTQLINNPENCRFALPIALEIKDNNNYNIILDLLVKFCLTPSHMLNNLNCTASHILYSILSTFSFTPFATHQSCLLIYLYKRSLALSLMDNVRISCFDQIRLVLPYYALPYSLPSNLPCLAPLLASPCPLTFGLCHLFLVSQHLPSTN